MQIKRLSELLKFSSTDEYPAYIIFSKANVSNVIRLYEQFVNTNGERCCNMYFYIINQSVKLYL
jgi:hypothetical protein